jgi:nitroimidazol reductase NimA-like FMN-containing flavoprotein (pyridoxamine 5'-phosphate oxidase superfamily)
VGSTESTEQLPKSPRSTLRRRADRGNHERRVLYAILDEGLMCHAGFQVDGQTFVQPMAYARIDDALYLHGAAANRMLRALADGIDACVTVTLLDGVVLARSAFHHSMNYRSVMLFVRGSRVTDEAEQRAAMDALLDHVAPGRSADARPPNQTELRSTVIVRFPIDEGSAKIRTGGPIEDPDDMNLAAWGGHIPLEVVAHAPVPDEGLLPGVETPGYATNYAVRLRVNTA